ncbi:MAG TPA: o-succinylbenzoate synthase, partial [Candidatus Obscuribacterales bacterium]
MSPSGYHQCPQRWTVRAYRRPLRPPLQTAHGLWPQREGLIVRRVDEQGQVGFGEIAPLPWFGTETQAQAQAFCAQWGAGFLSAAIAAIPDTLPACQFGLGTALSGWPLAGAESANAPQGADPPLAIAAADICALLPGGKAALTAWEPLWAKGHRTFKWKIGVASVAQELPIFQALVSALPREARLRLDANGGLSPAAAAAWLAACDRYFPQIEFLEQPLPPATILDWLPTVWGRFQTAIALDESVATLGQLRQVHQQVGDRVVYVVKPAIAGFPDQLAQFCQAQRLDVVFSSALETPI